MRPSELAPSLALQARAQADSRLPQFHGPGCRCLYPRRHFLLTARRSSISAAVLRQHLIAMCFSTATAPASVCKFWPACPGCAFWFLRTDLLRVHAASGHFGDARRALRLGNRVLLPCNMPDQHGHLRLDRSETGNASWSSNDVPRKKGV